MMCNDFEFSLVTCFGFPIWHLCVLLLKFRRFVFRMCLRRSARMPNFRDGSFVSRQNGVVITARPIEMHFFGVLPLQCILCQSVQVSKSQARMLKHLFHVVLLARSLRRYNYAIIFKQYVVTSMSYTSAWFIGHEKRIDGGTLSQQFQRDCRFEL